MILTFSNEYGAGALVLAQRVADALGYLYVDRQLPVVVAKRLQISPDDVDAGEDAGRTLGQRLLTSLERATPELAVSSADEPFDAELLRALQDAVREYASHGNVVIVGRGAGAILGARRDVLRIFIHAPRLWRVDHLVSALGVDAKTAASEIDRIDRARAAYIRDRYGLAFGDPHNYDLCVDTSRLEPAQSTALIVAAVKASQA